jgi:hypothetical protein
LAANFGRESKAAAFAKDTIPKFSARGRHGAHVLIGTEHWPERGKVALRPMGQIAVGLGPEALHMGEKRSMEGKPDK